MAELSFQDEQGFNQIFKPVGSTPFRAQRRHDWFVHEAQRLGALLPALRAAGSRPLIFSQWKIMLDVLEWVLHALGLSFFRLDGSTPVEERQKLVDAYNAPGSTVFAFLLSTRAGGQGINLTSADTVSACATGCDAPRWQCADARACVLPPHLRSFARRRFQPADRPAGGGPRAPAGADAPRDGVPAGHERHGG